MPRVENAAAGTFLFTMDGAFAGMVTNSGGPAAIVPGETLLALADRLRREEGTSWGHLAIEVQPLSRAIAAATGAQNGVVVTWVDPQGPSARLLSPMEVIDAVDGQPLETIEHWRTRVARLAVGAGVVLRVRSPRGTREQTVTAAAAHTAAEVSTPGVVLRTVRRTGAEVTEIARGSEAERAGLRVGDLITAAGEHTAPTAVQVLRTIADSTPDTPALVAVTRGTIRLVLAIEKRRPQ